MSLGPDQVLPATSLTCSTPDGAVKLRTQVDSPHLPTLAPMSVPTLLAKAAEARPDKVALAVKRNGEWIKWTYKQYYKDSR